MLILIIDKTINLECYFVRGKEREKVQKREKLEESKEDNKDNNI